MDRHSTKLIFVPPILAMKYILHKTLKELPSGSPYCEKKEWKRRSNVNEEEENAELYGSKKIFYKRNLRKQLVTKMSRRTHECTTMLSSAREKQRKRAALYRKDRWTAQHFKKGCKNGNLAPFFETPYTSLWNVTCQSVGFTVKAPSGSEKFQLGIEASQFLLINT